MKINDFIKNNGVDEAVKVLRDKQVDVPAWSGARGLVNEYDPKRHPIMNRSQYPDIVRKDGRLEKVTRVPLGLQKLATKRMTELAVGIPVKRTYKTDNDKQAELASYFEAIYDAVHIDSVNTDRLNMLFSGCEIMTLWFAVEQQNNLYGFDSSLKLRCRVYSPTEGDKIYPLFDEYDDLIALSIEYTCKERGKNVTYIDSYTADEHVRFRRVSGGKGWTIEQCEDIVVLGKIPAVYCYRSMPIWEDTTPLVEELEWTYSRNGNYLRRNQKPIFVVSADDDEVSVGEEEEAEENKEFRGVLQLPKGGTAGYATWQQAIDSLKFHTAELKQWYFSLLQLPDLSYETMKSTPMSGEARKEMFTDCVLKVQDESKPLLEMFSREANVIRAFLKVMLGEEWHADIAALKIEHTITPYFRNSDKDMATILTTLNGHKPIISQKESIELLGWSDNVSETMKQLQEEKDNDTLYQ